MFNKNAKVKLGIGILVLMLTLTLPSFIHSQTGKIRLLPENIKPFSASWSPDGKLIAFSVMGEPPAQAPSGVYIVTPDGKAVTTITEGIIPGEFVSYVSWSPNSRYITFSVGLTTRTEPQKFVASVNGTVLSQVNYNSFDVSFSPWRVDSQASFGLNEAVMQIVATGLDGKEIMHSDEILSSNALPDISPDETRIAIATENDIVLLDSMTLKAVARFPDMKMVSGIDWSPDGKMLLTLLVKPDQSSGDVLVLDATGKRLMNFEISTTLWDMVWSPDSTVIAEINKPGKNSKADVTFHHIDGRVLGSVSLGSEFSDWAPNNIYTMLTPEGNLVGVHFDGTEAYDLAYTADKSGSAYAPPILNWSPDGKLLALAPSPSNPCCAKMLWIYSADGKLLRTLERDKIEGNGDFLWSPASDALILFEGDNGVWLIKV